MSALVDDWSTFTPGWNKGTVDIDGSVVNALDVPTIGNGTLTGRIRRLNKGIEFAATLIVGSTTNFGTSASWYFNLPARFAPPTTWLFVATAFAYQSSSGLFWTGGVRIQAQPGATLPATMTAIPHFGSGVAPAKDTIPFSWAAGDRLVFGNALEAFDN